MEQRPQHQEKQASRKASPDFKPSSEPPRSCPRCDSPNTKFCYYNNYSSSQPRYFCRACRRYWTQGGTLRNLPHGPRRAAKHPKKPSFSAPVSAAPPLHHQMSVGAARPPPWWFGNGGLFGQPVAECPAVGPPFVVGVRVSQGRPEMVGVANMVAGEGGGGILPDVFDGFGDGSVGEGAVRRMPSASSEPFV